MAIVYNRDPVYFVVEADYVTMERDWVRFYKKGEPHEGSLTLKRELVKAYNKSYVLSITVESDQ